MTINTPLLKDDKNQSKIVCKRCNSVILKEGVAELEYQPELKDLIATAKGEENNNNNDSDKQESKKVVAYWSVSDMMTFENIGFSNKQEKIKFLVCADCEILNGFNVIGEDKFYVCIDLVKYL